MVSSEPQTFFLVSEEKKIMAVHPLNYNYLAYNDPFIAHERNMARLMHDLDVAEDRALLHLDQMVYDMNKKSGPQIAIFLPNTKVIECEDGSYMFIATNGEEFGERIVEFTNSHDYLKEKV